MKFSRSLVLSFVLLVLIASLYRVMPRPWGFAPQIAMALFAGSVTKDKKFAFALPLLSMFLSDLFYHILFLNHLTPIQGFYSGQLTNYLLITSLTVIGFFIREKNVLSIVAGSVAGPTIYFLASNFLVWAGGGGFYRPKTFGGLMMCYTDGLPFYQMSILATLFFGTVLFGGYYLLNRTQLTKTAS